MMNRTTPWRHMIEWSLTSSTPYMQPFLDVVVDGCFTSPSGTVLRMPGFYDGDGIWRVRFAPGEIGDWHYRIASRPHDDQLLEEGTFTVTPTADGGFVRSTPGQGWGFSNERGEPIFFLGDTVYHLFGYAHCGLDIQPFLARRAAQGFNLLRVRVPVSPLHPPDWFNTWQTRDCWPWGGSVQYPSFDRFNLDYFRSVDRVLQMAGELGLTLEMIMQAWGFEFPFNDRSRFLPEWEELWVRYLLARYDAYSAVGFWTVMNEYEYYPNGRPTDSTVANRWALRIGRSIKQTAPHGHPVAIHNILHDTPFTQCFAIEPETIDTVLFQSWGSFGEQDSWLAAGIEDDVARDLAGWPGSALLAEYGYENAPDLNKMVAHRPATVQHTRRGAWRGAMCGFGVVTGWEYTWGPFAVLDRDQPGMASLRHLQHFFTTLVPFARLRPAPELRVGDAAPAGYAPLVMATVERDCVVAYLPAGGTVTFTGLGPSESAHWYDPRTGELHPAIADDDSYHAPAATDADGHPEDWTLLLRRQS